MSGIDEVEHLTTEQVERILEIVQDADAIVVGGQSLNLWVRHYGLDRTLFADAGPFTSKDIDFFRNEQAAERLATSLVDGQIIIPRAGKRPVPESRHGEVPQEVLADSSIDDTTSNAAVVIGVLDDRKVKVDFMHSILGVEESSIQNNFVALQGELRSGGTVSIMLMHPLDVLRSRVANINRLGRHDELPVRQARAAVEVVRAFVDELLEMDEWRAAQKVLLDLFYVVRDQCMRHPAFLRHGIDPLPVMRDFMNDPGFDPRWREKALGSSVARLDKMRQAMIPAAVPPYPAETHVHKVSADGRTVIVRVIDPATGEPGAVDNPLGPARVAPDGSHYALAGEEMSEAEWRERVGADATSDADAPQPT